MVEKDHDIHASVFLLFIVSAFIFVLSLFIIYVSGVRELLESLISFPERLEYTMLVGSILLIIVTAIHIYKKLSIINKLENLLSEKRSECYEIERQIESSLIRQSKVKIIESEVKEDIESKVERIKNQRPQVFDRYGNISNLKYKFNFKYEKEKIYVCFLEYDLLVLKDGITKNDYNMLVRNHNQIAEEHNLMLEEHQLHDYVSSPISLEKYI